MGNWSSNTREEEESILGKDGKTPRLYEQTLDPEQLPIVYSSAYNIGFLGMERIHPFDSGKWGKVYQHLVGKGFGSVESHRLNGLTNRPLCWRVYSAWHNN